MQCEMKNGDRVKIIFSTWNRKGIEGAFGTIVAENFNTKHDFSVRVDFPGYLTEELGFNENELELIEADNKSEDSYFDLA